MMGLIVTHGNLVAAVLLAVTLVCMYCAYRTGYETEAMRAACGAVTALAVLGLFALMIFGMVTMWWCPIIISTIGAVCMKQGVLSGQ